MFSNSWGESEKGTELHPLLKIRLACGKQSYLYAQDEENRKVTFYFLLTFQFRCIYLTFLFSVSFQIRHECFMLENRGLGTAGVLGQCMQKGKPRAGETAVCKDLSSNPRTEYGSAQWQWGVVVCVCGMWRKEDTSTSGAS